MRLVMVLLIISLSSCTASKCKTPWWKFKKPNTYYNKVEKDSDKKYRQHKKSEKRNHRCKR